MKNIFLTIIVIFQTSALAQEVNDCLNLTPAQTAVLTATSPLNCHIQNKFLEDESVDRINLKALNKALNNKPFKAPDYKKSYVCDSCKNHFLNKLVDEKKEEFLKRKKENFLKLTYEEMSKTMSATLLDVATLRNMFQSSDFKKSKNSCGADQFQAKLNSCPASVREFISANKFTQKMSNDLSSFVSPTQQKVNGFFKRENSNSCGISEKELLLIKTLSFEQSFAPEAINTIASIPENIDSRELFNLISTKDEFSEVKNALTSHPLLRVLMKSPSKLINIFKKVKTGQKLSEALYNNNELNKQIDDEISQRCDQAYSGFINSVCNKNFEDGNITLGPLKNYEKLLGDKSFQDHPETLASKDNIISDNMNLLSFCDFPQNEDTPSLSITLNKINNWMLEDSERNRSLERFTHELYKQKIEEPLNNLCEIVNNESKCENFPTECPMFKLWKGKSNKNSIVAKLLDTPNSSVNDLLRSFVPSNLNYSKDLSIEVKTILRTEGILPKDNGQYEPRTVVSRPEPSQVRSIESVSQSATAPSSNSQNQTSSSSSAIPKSRLASNGFNPTVGNSAAASTNDWSESSAIDRIEELSRMSDVERKKLQDTESEILRRLTDSKNSYRPNKEEVNRVTRDTLKKNNQFLSPTAQNKLSEQIYDDINDAGTARNVMMAPTPQQRENNVALGPASGPSKSERNWNGALAKMANAEGSANAVSKDAARSPASQKEFTGDAQPTLKITVAKNDLKNIESILTQQLSNKVGDSFKLEIFSAASNETLSYEVKKSSNGLVVLPLGSSAMARQYLDSVQKVVNKLYIQQSQTRMVTRQALLQTLGGRTPSQN